MSGLATSCCWNADRIEDTNLNRLVDGRTSDVKRKLPKVQITKRLIKAINPTAAVVAKVSPWQGRPR
jgi:molybdopterin/thiamine biosynthesis adenylyltransferase